MKFFVKGDPALPSILSRWRFVLVFTVLALLSACGNRYAEEVQTHYAEVQTRLAQLKDLLNKNSVPNAKIIGTYADEAIKQKPELANVVDAFRKEVTPEGRLYQTLQLRLNQVNKDPQDNVHYLAAMDELNSIWTAADPVIFNNALVDVINSIADLSGGTLPRLPVPQMHKSTEQRTAQNSVPGGDLVGNPAYGEWRRNESGGSFWSWYGAFRVLQDILNANTQSRAPIDYDTWYRRPRSGGYYDSYGRDHYGSASDRGGWYSRDSGSGGFTPPRAKDYGSVLGKKRSSTYGFGRDSGSSYGGGSGNSPPSGGSIFGGSSYGGGGYGQLPSMGKKRSSSYSTFGSGSSSSYGGFGRSRR